MCRVMILDDNIYFADTIKIILEGANEAQADVTNRLEDAVERAIQAVQKGKPYEVFLIDQRLGTGKDGIDAMKELRQISPDSDAIIFTGYEDNENGLRAYEAGAFRYLAKPFENKELFFLLKALKQWRKEQREHGWQKIFSSMMETAIKQKEFHDVASVVVNYSLKLGFERAHLLWVPTRRDANKGNQLVGIKCSGKDCIPNFPNNLYTLKDLFNFDQIYQSHDAIFLPESEMTKNRPNKIETEGYVFPAKEVILLPLWSSTNLMGLLIIDYGRAEKSLREYERSLLNLFARQVSVVLENASTYNREQRSLKENSIIGNMSRQITTKAAIVDLTSLLEEVREQVRQLMDVSNFAVVLQDDEANELDFHLLYEHNLRREGIRRPIGTGMEGYLLTQHVEVFLPKGVKEFSKKNKIQINGRIASSWLGVPLMVSDQIIGGIIIQHFDDEQRFEEKDRRLLVSVANQVAGAIQISRLSEQEKEETRRLQILQQASLEMLRIAQENEEDLWFTVLTVATANFGLGFNRALLFMINDDPRKLVGQLGVGTENTRAAILDWERDEERRYDFDAFLTDLRRRDLHHTPFEKLVRKVKIALNGGEDAVSQVIISGTRRIVPEKDIPSTLPVEINQVFSLTNCAILPLRVGDNTLGTIIVDNKHNGKRLDEKALNRLQTLLDNAGLVWETLRQRRKSESLLKINYDIMGEAIRQPIANTLQRICETIHIISEADWTIIYPFKPGERYSEFDKECISHMGELKQPLQSVIKEKLHPEGISAYILKEGSLIVHNLDHDDIVIGRQPLSKNDFIQREGVKALIGVPIADVHTTEKLGILYLDYRKPRAFTELEILHAKSFASLAAVAITSARQFEAEVAAHALDNAHTQEHLNSVLNTARAVTAPTDLNKTLKAVAETVLRVSPDLSALTLWYRHPLDSDTLILGWTFGLHKKIREVQREYKQNSKNIVQTIMCFDKPLLASDISKYPELVGKFSVEERIVSAAAFPLRADNENVGAMFFNYRKKHNFIKEEEVIFTLLAEIVAASIRDASRLEEEKRQHMRLAAALQTAEKIGSSLVLDEILEAVLGELQRFFNETNICILLYHEDENALKFAPGTSKFYQIESQQYKKQQVFPLEKGSIACKVALQSLKEKASKTVNASDVRNDPTYLELNPSTQSELCVSFMGTENNLLGVLVLERAETNGFNDDDIALVNMVARQIGVAIERAQQSEQLDFKSTVAAMTAWAADMAHDINNQVGQIQGLAYMIKEYADHINESAKTLSSAGPWSDQGKQLIQVDNALEKYIEPIARQRNIVVEMCPGTNGAQIFVNPTEFQRVLRHLVRNASKAMSNLHEKKIIISTRVLDGNLVEIWFRDFGPGVKDTIRNSIFQKSVTTKKRGGYGLLLTRQLIEDMGGKIKLLPSEPGSGAVFSIKLPMSESLNTSL